jgi:CBS domain-containing protein
MRIRDVMDPRFTAAPAATPIGRALELLAEGALDCLVVTRDGRVAGVLPRERVEWLAASHPSLPIGLVMIARPETVGADEPPFRAAAALLDHRQRCVPVMDDGRVVGVVTPRDLLRVVLRAA